MAILVPQHAVLRSSTPEPSSSGTSRMHVAPFCPARSGGPNLASAARTVFGREAAANVPGPTRSSRYSRGPVSHGDHPRPELMAIHELELDALAQTGEQRRPVSGKDRLHQEHVLVDQSQICQPQGKRHATHEQALARLLLEPPNRLP